MNFTEELRNKNSSEFKSLARDVETALLPPLKQQIPSVGAIDVYAFKAGSVIAQYNIIMGRDGRSVNVSQIQSALTDVITNGNLTINGKKVDSQYIYNVTKRTIGTICLTFPVFHHNPNP